MTDLERAREKLSEGGYTCVLCRGDQMHVAIARGVAPLVRWLDSGDDFTGFSAADKVVGKATAYLYCLLGVRAVHAVVMSSPARAVLEAYGVAAEDVPYWGQFMRDLREVLARNKDVLWCLLQPEPTFLGEAIPISGNGDLSNG